MLKERIENLKGAVKEAVTVNQRSLIDKILARYSTELTVFRELLQNSDDARAKRVQIRFDGCDFWKDHSEGSKKKSSKYYFNDLRVCNDGGQFEEEDWSRIKSIADGNPNETKVGFFGVGFYSVFSHCEEPTVLSGNRALCFFWKGNGLHVVHGDIPHKDEKDTAEMNYALEAVQTGWTVFDLAARPNHPKPRLPDLNHFTDFLLNLLAFSTTLREIEVFVDGKSVLSVGRESLSFMPLSCSDFLSKASGVTLQKLCDPLKLFVYRQSFVEILAFSYKHFDMLDSVSASLVKLHNMFDASLRSDFVVAMKRVTKKNPPCKIVINLLFDLTGEKHAGDSLNKFSPAHCGGYFYIGSGITQQSTGSKCHCQAPFMPTMERNAIDFSDVTLGTWNRSLLWICGAMQRLAYEYNSSSKALHYEPDINNGKLRLTHGSKVGLPLVSDGKGLSSGTDVTVDGRDELVSNSSEALWRMRVHASMATFVLLNTTPVQEVGEILHAGFFAAFGYEAPTVWTTHGVMSASRVRIEDDPDLRVIVNVRVPAFVFPEKNSNGAAENSQGALAHGAQSTISFFANLLGISSSQQYSSENLTSNAGAKSRTQASLCKHFVRCLQTRHLIRKMDIRDLVLELQSRDLSDANEAVLLCKWLLKYASAIRSTKMNIQHDGESLPVRMFCNYCGYSTQVKLSEIESEFCDSIRIQKRGDGVFESLKKGFLGQESSELKKTDLPSTTFLCAICHKKNRFNPSMLSIPVVYSPKLFSGCSIVDVLSCARLDGRKLSSYSRFIPKIVLQRLRGSCDSLIITEFQAQIRRAVTVDALDSLMPLSVSNSFADAELLSMNPNWLKGLKWIEWVPNFISFSSVVKNPQCDQKLCLISNLLRVLSVAVKEKDIVDDELVLLISALDNKPCIPVSNGDLMIPKETYLALGDTDGFNSLPVVAFTRKLEKDNFSKQLVGLDDTVLCKFLCQLGVKDHIDIQHVFNEFNKGTLEWKRQDILRYVGLRRNRMEEVEIARLSRTKFLPAAEIDENGIAWPSSRSYKGNELYFPKPAFVKMGLPIIYCVLTEGVPLDPSGGNKDKGDGGSSNKSRGFFDMHREDTISSTTSLLRELGVRDSPPLPVIAKLAMDHPSQCSIAALAYLVENMFFYRSEYARSNYKIVPCKGESLQLPRDCFVNGNASLLALPVVDADLLSASDASVLGVNMDPGEDIVLSRLRAQPPSASDSMKLFEYLFTLLPTFSPNFVGSAKQISFVPCAISDNVLIAGKEKRYRYCAPCDVFFLPTDDSPGRYHELFPYVCATSTKAAMFLKSVGVREQPTVEELAKELAVEGRAYQFVSRIGFEHYIQVLRLIAVEWDAKVSRHMSTKMSNSKWLVALKSTLKTNCNENFNSVVENSDEDAPSPEDSYLSYSLEKASNIYISDSDVLERMFSPLYAPQDTAFEKMYNGLGSKYLSAAVSTKTTFVGPIKFNSVAQKLEERIRARNQLFFFKRHNTDFVRDHVRWVEMVNKQDSHFVFTVSKIRRVLKLENVIKEKPCTAFFHREKSTSMLLILDKYDFYDCASELCSALLVKSTIHDSVCWTTLLQQTDETLRGQGFPLRRKLHVKDITTSRAPAPVEKLPDLKTASTAEMTKGESQKISSSSIPPSNPISNAKDGGNLSQSQKSLSLSAGAHSTMQESKPSRAQDSSRFGRSLVDDVKALVGSTLRKSKQKLNYEPSKEDLDEKSRLIAQNGRKGYKPSSNSEHGALKRQPQVKVQNKAVKAGTNTFRKDLTVDRDERHKMLREGLDVSSGARVGMKSISSEKAQIVSTLDDLHEQNLRRTEFTYCGIICYVESSMSSDEVFKHYDLEVTAFAQLLSGILNNVFGVKATNCGIYYHYKGPTAAFNRNGALFFNVAVFLDQYKSRRWSEQLRITAGANNSVQYFLPTECCIEWYGIICHELAHNIISSHDASFANWMSFYLCDFIPKLNAFIETCDIESQKL